MTEISELLKAAADENRLRIIRLFQHSGTALCVCEIVDALDLAQYQVSRHLSALKTAGLVTATKHGTWAYYELTDSPRVTGLLTYIASAPLDAEAEKQVRRDRNALDLRLALRDGGMCVVGLSPPAESTAHD